MEEQLLDVAGQFDDTRSASMNREFMAYCLTENHPFVVDLRGCHDMYLHTIDGQDIFDWSGLYGSKLLGYNHPGLYEQDYVDKLIVAANNKLPNPDYFTPECFDFYKMAKAFAPESMREARDLEIYAVNSGAEVMENMLKYFISKHLKEHAARADAPKRFIFFKNSFHGRTLFTLSITRIHNQLIHRDFRTLFGQNLQATFPGADFSDPELPSIAHYNRMITEGALGEIEAYLAQYPGEVVGIIVEPIQSAGGHRVALPSFFTRLSELAHRYDTYLGFDEIQTGVAATGKRFLIDHYELPYPPQAVVTAKKMGVGLLYMLDHLEDVGVLDSTWGGPLVDMVRVTQELTIVARERLIEHAAELGQYLESSLRALVAAFPTLLYNVRGMGLVTGFTVLDPRGQGLRDSLLEIALKKHLLLMLDAGADSIRLRPNLSVTRDDVDRFCALLADALTILQEESLCG